MEDENETAFLVAILIVVLLFFAAVQNNTLSNETKTNTIQGNRGSILFTGTVVSKETIKLTVNEVFGEGWEEEYAFIIFALEDGNITSGIPDVEAARLKIGDKIVFERDWRREKQERERGLQLSGYQLFKIRRMPE